MKDTYSKILITDLTAYQGQIGSEHYFSSQFHPENNIWLPTGADLSNNQEEHIMESSDCHEQSLKETQTRIENNIETLDYLRGISCLERDFVFYLEIENIERKLDEIDSHLDGLVTVQTPSEQNVNALTSDIHQILESLVQAFSSWQKLSQRVQLVSPLHRRMPLSRGLHSGVLLTSITLPLSSGKPGKLLHSGTRIQVRANPPADLLHREWFLVDRDGLVVASIPAAFVWLESPEHSPERPLNTDYTLKSERSLRRSRSVPTNVNNLEIIEDLRKQIFRMWQKACSKYDQILREMSISFLKDSEEDSKESLNAEEIARVDKALQKISELVGIVEYKDEDGTEKLIELLDEAKAKRFDQGEKSKCLNVDVKSADALVGAIDVFEEMVGCYQRNATIKTPDVVISKDEIEKDLLDITERVYVSPKISLESIRLQSSQPTIYAEPENVVVSKKKFSKTPDFPKSPKMSRHKLRHRSLTLETKDDNLSCPHSPTSSFENLHHSVSLVSRHSKEEEAVEKPTPEGRSLSRGRKRDRFYNILPFLLRRHPHSKKKKSSKFSDDGESGFSDNDTSHTYSRGSQKITQLPVESLSLGRVSYIKNSDVIKPKRTPLSYSTFAMGDSTDGNTTPFEDSTLKRDHSKKVRTVLYSTACQNGVCGKSEITEIQSPIYEEQIVPKVGKKMQVGRSYTAEQPPETAEIEAREDEITRIESNHVYANIDTGRIYPIRQSTPENPVYDIGVQADLPNRLRGLRCRLEFERPGVELGDKDQVSCEAFKGAFDNLNIENVETEQDFKTLSFRVAFNNRSSRSSTL
ncbi:unnamed protein product [Rodentolepis nana]|uniref:Unc-13 homolog C n=1 Tax=Rodentolepis nana TaxID=102285 RepID=A0A0R3TCN2_RODNA|nr:unnamed protein product [Rodentolepis nana]